MLFRSVKHEEVTFEQLLAEKGQYMLQYQGFVQVDPAKGISKEAAELMRRHGWVHKSTAEGREEKKVLEDEYWLLDETPTKGSYWQYRETKFSSIDIDNLSDDQLRQLAKTGKIVQVVSTKSVLSADQYKKLQTKKKQLADQQAKAKAASEAKAAKKKAKEIAAAKKLLEEAGVT